MSAAPRLLALVGAVLMPGSLFLNWYGVEAHVFTPIGFKLDGWDVFESTDAVLVLAGLAVLLLLFRNPPHASRILMIVGALATTFLAVQLLDQPAILGFSDVPGLSLEVGAWVGLSGALLTVGAGALGSARLSKRHQTMLLAFFVLSALLISGVAWALHADEGPKVETATQLFLVRSDGSGLRKLTRGPASHSFFSWSPDGRRIAYSSEGKIMVASVEESSPQLVIATHGLFAWSPKRDEIAFFVAGQNCETSGRCKTTIKTVRSDGSHVRTLTSRSDATFFKSGADWSSSGEELVFPEQVLERRVPVIDGPVDLVVVSRHGKRHSLRIAGDEWDPDWSPDGRSILFLRQLSHAGVGLWRSSPTGRALRPIVRRVLGRAPAAWSPDGRSIAFTGVLTRTGGNHLYVVPSRGGSPREVVEESAFEFAPSWSPDGSRLAFGDFEGHVRVVRPDGSRDRAIATLSNAEFFDLAWSPDGRWIAFAAGKRPPES
jgi:Tol biopolymer transport system component